MTHVAIVPFARPCALPRLEALASAHPDVTFLLVENGPAVGSATERPGLHVVRSRPSAGAARNVGIEWARARGFSTLSFLDDDDYYGPLYLTEARVALETHDVVHKGIGFVRMPDGLWLFDNRRAYRCLIGNSISARVETCPRFSEARQGEEFPFTTEMRRRGLREHVLPPFGFVYDRSHATGHGYACTPIQFLRAHGPAAFLGDLPDSAVDLGGVPSDEEVFQDLESLARRAS